MSFVQVQACSVKCVTFSKIMGNGCADSRSFGFDIAQLSESYFVWEPKTCS